MNIQSLQNIDQADRVRKLTPGITQEFDQEMQERIRAYADVPAAVLDERIQQLSREWDLGRTVIIQASLTALLGVLLGMLVNRKWFYLTIINQSFLLQHSLLGWCPPAVLHRRLGMRTRREIMLEWTALKALRGDFGEMPDQWDADRRAREAYAATIRG